MHKDSCVYWIHLPEHLNMLSEGYIGVASNGVEKRLSVHRHAVNNGSELHVHRAMRLREDYVVDVLIKAPPEYCYEVEARLRPNVNIGWNIAQGGNVSPTLGLVPSEDTRNKISASNRGRIVSEDTKLKLSLANKGRRLSQDSYEALCVRNKASKFSDLARHNAKIYLKSRMPWENGKANKFLWLKADVVYNFVWEDFESNINKVCDKFEVSKSAIKTLYNKIKAGWNPLQDTEWLIFSSKLTPDISGDKSLNPACADN